MNILIVLPNNGDGGTEQLLKMIGKYFKNDSVNFVYFKKEIDRSLNFGGNVTERFMTSKSEKVGWLLFLAKIFEFKKKYDYIFTSHIYVSGTIDMLLSLRLLKTKHFIVRESTSIFLRFKGLKLWSYKMMYFLGYRNISLLICQTELMKLQLLNHFPKLNKRTLVKVIPNPIDIHEIKKKEREPTTINLPKNFIVSAGRLMKVKGFDILIKAFSQIKPKYPDLKLLILGYDWDQKEELVELTNDLNLTDDVVFTGYVENVYYYFKHAKLCVVSSRMEGFPNVLLQMMSQNNNVVSTKCAGGIDLIPGLITSETNNKDSLLEALLKALSTAESKLELNRKLFDTYLKDRDISNFIKKIINFVDH